MTKPIKQFFRSDVGILVVIAFARIVFHVATNGQYGFHRDELQTLDDARHLDWGFVAYPPLTPLVGRLELVLFGTSLIGFRLFPAIAVSLVMLLTGLMAKELGGSRHVQVLAAIAAGISPVSLAQGAVLQYVSFDYLWAVTASYFLVRLLRTDDPRWWVPIGAVLGLGMETRYTIGFLALGIVGAVLLTPLRKHLASKWLWIGVAASVLIILPNVIWQARHHFISLEFLAYLRARDSRQGRYHGFYREQVQICVNLMTAPLAALGLWFYLLRQEGKKYRALGWVVVVSFALFAVFGARSYYTAPLYPILLAAGCVLLANWVDGLRPVWQRIAYGVQWAAIALGGAAFILLVTPVAPFGSGIWKITSRVHDQFREEIGWLDLVQSVAGVYNALSPEERARAGILAGNYGEGGALNLYGPRAGLPPAMTLTNSLWYRTFDSREPQTVIVVGFDVDEAQRLFASCAIAAKNRNRLNVENEESRDHPDILVCENLKMPWKQYWATHRRFG